MYVCIKTYHLLIRYSSTIEKIYIIGMYIFKTNKAKWRGSVKDRSRILQDKCYQIVKKENCLFFVNYFITFYRAIEKSPSLSFSLIFKCDNIHDSNIQTVIAILTSSLYLRFVFHCSEK